MEAVCLDYGLPALFLVSFLAATVLPLGSEWLLVALLINGSGQWQVVMVATAGNYLGACTTYGVGILGSSWLMSRILRIDASRQGRAMGIYSRYGAWSLLLSWVPVIGDALCLVSGTLRLNFFYFTCFTFSGKFFRYLAVAIITVNGFI